MIHIEPSSVFEARRFNNECSIPSAHCRSVDSVRIASHGPTTNEPELCCNRSGRLTVSILNLLLSKDLLFFVLKLIFARIQIELATQNPSEVKKAMSAPAMAALPLMDFGLQAQSEFE